ncbi:MAG: hypothetical protein JWO03_643 [Bacteroidetes bacterium]|nr:hypothetical protein [Bacteroidota bacterium]
MLSSNIKVKIDDQYTQFNPYMKAASSRFLFLILFLSCFLGSGSISAHSEDAVRLSNGHYIYQYVALSDEYLADGNYEACLSVSDTILKYYPESGRAQLIRANIFLKEHLWKESVAVGEEAAKTFPADTSLRKALYEADMQLNRPQEAGKEANILARLNPSDSRNSVRQLEVKKKIILIWLSRIFTGILICMLSFLLYQVYERNSKAEMGGSFKKMWPLEVIFIPSSITLIGYLLFYHFSGYIWSKNIHYPTQDYNPYIIRDFIFDHDGIEGYTLYLMFLAIAFFSAIAFILMKKIRSKVVYYLLLAASGICTLVLLGHTGFYPPFADLADAPLLLLPVSFLFAGLVWWLTTLAMRHPKRGFVIMALILAVMFFIPYAPISVYDYGYILSPALRLFYGEHIPNVYFQYDLYMSLMALGFMKLGISAYNLIWVARIGYYIFFILLFIFARRVFHEKKLAFLLIAFDILIRYYANMDPVGYFQITLWRIDLWLILLCLVYWRGVYHWSVALFLGLLIIFHRNFGFIYLGAYIQLIIALPILECIKGKAQDGFFTTIFKVLRSISPNILILVIAFGGSYWLLGGMLPSSALAYQKIGIGMMKIAATSFYWYTAILLGAIVILLVRHHERISEKYFVSGIFLVLLTIGNSMYFFGRSHEHNVLNLAGTLSLCFFMFIDLLAISIREAQLSDNLRRWLRYIITAIPLVSIGLAVFCYLGSMGWKFQHQFEYMTDNKVTFKPELKYDFKELRKLTNDSRKVFFLEFEKDFLYYYEGGYKPMGYFNPNDAWVLKKDMAAMMQNLIDSGYYIAVTDHKYADEFLTLLNYDRCKTQGKYSVCFKSENAPLAPDPSLIFSRQFVDTIPSGGIRSPALILPKEYTVDCGFAVDSTQRKSNAIIFSNLNTALDYQGMSLTADPTGEHVVFTYGLGSQQAATPPLPIRRGWANQFTATIKPGVITLYINEEKVWEKAYIGEVANSDRPFMIGNNEKGDERLDGHVYLTEIRDK